MNQGEIWLLETPNSKRRPVLIVSRTDVIPVVNNIVVAPITSTFRAIPTCIPVGRAEGIDHANTGLTGVATLDNLTTVPKSLLTHRLGSLRVDARHQICAALAALGDC